MVIAATPHGQAWIGLFVVVVPSVQVRKEVLPVTEAKEEDKKTKKTEATKLPRDRSEAVGKGRESANKEKRVYEERLKR